MTRRRAALKVILLALFVVATPQAAFSTTPPVVTLDAELSGRDELLITVTSHMERISAVSVEVSSAGELFMIDIAPIPLQLPLEVPVTVRAPVHLTPNGRFGTAIVRVVGAGLGTLKVVEFTFTRTDGGPQRVSHTQYAAAVNAILDDRDAAAAEQRAAELIRSVLARGKRPVATGGVLPSAPGRAVENSNFERAWNRLVAQLDAAKNSKAGLHVSGESLHPRPALNCGPYVESPDNRDYPLQGNIYYDNDHFGFHRLLQEPGYQGFVTTNVAFENDCFVQYRIRAFDYTTSWSGSFSVTVRTIDDPSVRDPILYVSTTAPDAGERTCAESCTTINTVQQLLYPTDDHFQYLGGTIQLAPYYNRNIAPSAYLFHWNDEIKSLQRNWSYYGFGQSYTPFIAGHDSSVGQSVTAYFYQVPPGIIAFDDSAEWPFLWVIAHECGHFFQFKLQNNQLGYGQPHNACQQIDVGPAFREGFADWHASFWETDGRFIYMPCNGDECYSNCGSGGYRVELNVAAFFWDVFDNANDPNSDQSADTVVYPLSLLFNWAGRDYTSFDDFYADFRDRGAWGSSESVTATLRTVNRINVP